MKLRREILCMILLLMAVRVGGQGLPPIMFWNVENYYDSFDDEKSADEEFLPNSEKRWSWGRFVKKRNAIAKTISVPADASLVVLDKASAIYLEEDKSIGATAGAADDLVVICSWEEIS